MNRKYILVTVVALVVLISLCYLYFHKIKETRGEVIAINIQKYFISTDKCPWTLNPIFCCSRKKSFFLYSFFQLFLFIDNLYIPKWFSTEIFFMLYFWSILEEVSFIQGWFWNKSLEHYSKKCGINANERRVQK